MGPCCEQTHAPFEVGLSLDHGQGVYSGWSDVVVSSQLRLCHTCIIDVMRLISQKTRMHLFHIPECSIQNRNVHISVLNGAFWDMKQVNSGICELSQLHPWFSVEYNYSPMPKLIVGLAIPPLKLGHG